MSLERLTSRKRGKGRLATPPKREQIPARRVTALRGGAESSGGISSPLTEQPFTGVNYYSLTSSDGLLVLSYGEWTDYLDSSGRDVRVEHINQDA